MTAIVRAAADVKAWRDRPAVDRWLRFVDVVINIVIMVFVIYGIMIVGAAGLHGNQLWVSHTRDVQVTIRSAVIAILDAESNQRSYLLTGKDVYLKSYGMAKENVRGQVAELRRLTADNPRQQDRVAELASVMDRKIAFLDKFNELRRHFKDTLKRVDIDEGHLLILRARDILHRMDNEEKELYDIRDRRMKTAMNTIYGGIAVAMGRDILILMMMAPVLIQSAWHRRSGPES